MLTRYPPRYRFIITMVKKKPIIVSSSRATCDKDDIDGGIAADRVLICQNAWPS